MTLNSDVLQFVDSISASPTVLLDLNNQAPIYLAEDGWSAPPPRLDRTASSSTSRDGTSVAQSAYADRELVITVGLDTATPDQAAEAIQAIARLLNSEGQWLKYQTAIEPVFFRTKRAEIDALAEFNGQRDGFREVTLRIPAEPFAYGLPVTGTTTINNDPTAATNPMSYVFPAIQGDVATPVSMSLVSEASHASLFANLMLSMSSGSNVPTTPAFVQTVSVTGASAGWTYTGGFADVDGIGGTVSRYVKASGTLTAGPTLQLPSSQGDYRILARLKASADGTAQLVMPDGVTKSTRTLEVDADYHWYDFGVFRLPDFYSTTAIPVVDQPSTSGTTAVSIYLNLTGATGDVRVDGVLAVPAGLDDDAASSLLLGAGGGSAASGWTTFVDSLSSRLLIYKSGLRTQSVAVAGGFPSLLPGTRNVMTLVRALPFSVGSDPLTAGGVMNYLYYPRYLYIRPATT